MQYPVPAHPAGFGRIAGDPGQHVAAVDEGRVETGVEGRLEGQHAGDARIKGNPGQFIVQRIGCTQQRGGLRRRGRDQEPPCLQTLARIQLKPPVPIELQGRNARAEATIQTLGQVTAHRVHARHRDESPGIFRSAMRVAVARLFAEDSQARSPGLNQAGVSPLLEVAPERGTARGEILRAVVELGAVAAAGGAAPARPARLFQHDHFPAGPGQYLCRRESGPAGADDNRVDTHLPTLARQSDHQKALAMITTAETVGLRSARNFKCLQFGFAKTRFPPRRMIERPAQPVGKILGQQ